MSENETVDVAAKTLFKLLSGASPVSDEYAHSYDEMPSYEDFWSNHSNSRILEILEDLCQHFGIDHAKVAAFMKSIIDCDYCGEHTSKVQRMSDGEHVCEECLKKMGER